MGSSLGSTVKGAGEGEGPEKRSTAWRGRRGCVVGGWRICGRVSRSFSPAYGEHLVAALRARVVDMAQSFDGKSPSSR